METITTIRTAVDALDLATIMGTEPYPDDQEAELLDQLASHYEREIADRFPGADVEVTTDRAFGGAVGKLRIEPLGISEADEHSEIGDTLTAAFDAAVTAFLAGLAVEA